MTNTKEIAAGDWVCFNTAERPKIYSLPASVVAIDGDTVTLYTASGCNAKASRSNVRAVAAFKAW